MNVRNNQLPKAKCIPAQKLMIATDEREYGVEVVR